MPVNEERDPRLQAAQNFTDAMIARFGGPAGREQSAPEERVAVSIDLWEQLEWLEDGPLTDAIAKSAEDGYAEGEEEGGWYVFYCHGLNLQELRDLVDSLVNTEAQRYKVTIEYAPETAVEDQEVRVVLA